MPAHQQQYQPGLDPVSVPPVSSCQAGRVRGSQLLEISGQPRHGEGSVCNFLACAASKLWPFCAVKVQHRGCKGWAPMPKCSTASCFQHKDGMVAIWPALHTAWCLVPLLYYQHACHPCCNNLVVATPPGAVAGANGLIEVSSVARHLSFTVFKSLHAGASAVMPDADSCLRIPEQARILPLCSHAHPNLS